MTKRTTMVNTKGSTPLNMVYMGTSRCAPARLNTTTPTGGVMQPNMMQSTVITPNLQRGEAQVLGQQVVEDGQGDDHHRPDVHQAAEYQAARPPP